MANTATPTAPAELVFTDAEVPITNSVKSNPFEAAVVSLNAVFDDEAGKTTKALTVTLPSMADASKAKGQVQRAAHALTPKRSPRYRVTPVKDGESPVTFTFWLITYSPRGTAPEKATEA